MADSGVSGSGGGGSITDSGADIGMPPDTLPTIVDTGGSDDNKARDASTAGLCDPSDGRLIACFRFEPSSPPVRLADDSASHHDGTATGVSYVSGEEGEALEFNPNLSFVTVDDAPTFSVLNMTAELWIRPTATVATGQQLKLFDKNLSYTMYLADGNTLACKITDATSTGMIAISTATIPLATWTHVACTYDRMLNQLTVYANGAPLATVSGTGMPPAIRTDALVIGGNSPCSGAPCQWGFAGDLDSLRLWNYARSRAEICADAGAACGGN